jgi:hypothetical protein
MASQGLEAKPEAVPALRGDGARAAFISSSFGRNSATPVLNLYGELDPAATVKESLTVQTEGL